MGLFDKIRRQLVDIIQWLDDSNDTLAWRFERYNNEIKYGAKLVVREGQVAVFVNEGQLADVFKPGTYTLQTQNLPILTTLLSWKHGFESPFKAEVYFINTRQFTDLKWGTMNPVMLRDPEFGPVRLRAHGNYQMRVSDAKVFLREVVGTDGHFTKDEIVEQLRNVVVSRFTDILGQSKIPILDLAANYDELGQFLTEKIKPEFSHYGLDLTKLLVENISLPPAVEQALDKRSSMGIVGNLQAYTQFEAANALGDAARNPGAGGVAAAGMTAGLGMMMGQQIAATAAGGAAPAAGGGAPPPLPTPVQFYAALNGQQAGPFDITALQQHAAGGRITPQTLVWRQGMAQWLPAAQLAELGGLFAPPPPPLPPALPNG